MGLLYFIVSVFVVVVMILSVGFSLGFWENVIRLMFFIVILVVLRVFLRSGFSSFVWCLVVFFGWMLFFFVVRVLNMLVRIFFLVIMFMLRVWVVFFMLSVIMLRYVKRRGYKRVWYWKFRIGYFIESYFSVFVVFLGVGKFLMLCLLRSLIFFLISLFVMKFIIIGLLYFVFIIVFVIFLFGMNIGGM